MANKDRNAWRCEPLSNSALVSNAMVYIAAGDSDVLGVNANPVEKGVQENVPFIAVPRESAIKKACSVEP